MEDTRIYTKQAIDLMNSGKPVILRNKLNGKIYERVFKPFAIINHNYRLYTNKMKVYDVLDNCIKLQHTQSYPSITTEKGVLSTVLETLLISGYTIYDE